LEATLPIKPLQMWLVINVEPLNTAFLGYFYGLLDQCLTNAPPAQGRMNCCIQDKGMATAIPSQINKSNQVILVIGAYISQTPL
jgi:hypothetical protein